MALVIYDHKGETLPVLSMLFWARLQTDRPLAPADDVAAIHITDIKDVDFSRLHDKDIEVGVRKLQQILL